MADVCRDWLTGQTVDCCFVVIGLVEHIPESFAQYQKQTRLDPVGLPSLLSGIIGRMTYDNISTNYLPTYLLTVLPPLKFANKIHYKYKTSQASKAATLESSKHADA